MIIEKVGSFFFSFEELVFIFLKKAQLSLKHEFELHSSTSMWIFFNK